ncbi:hypothetical protein GCM10027290_62640 [Micromonospora sonneratiae]|uniref:ATP-binding protein n=1 Tax=Micromonospora sonneratiae TaxID=1184706 RepID=A0ABW3YEM7_9ACTN
MPFSTSRLVTLNGPGGAGKSRLAVELARRRREPVGPWLVELAAAQCSALSPGERAAVAQRHRRWLRAVAEVGDHRQSELRLLNGPLCGRRSWIPVDSQRRTAP